MLVHWLMNLIKPVLDLLLGWIPVPDMPPLGTYVASLAPLFQWVGWMNRYLPIELALNLGLALLGMMVVRQTVLFGIWFLTKLHILGGSS